MQRILFCSVLTGMVFLACNSRHSDSKASNEYQEAKETLQDKEKNNPGDFLIITSRDKKNLIGQRVVKGSISNNATICTYSNVELELTFFSETDQLLETAHETIFETIKPGHTVEFKTKYFAPKGTDHVKIKFSKAASE